MDRTNTGHLSVAEALVRRTAAGDDTDLVSMLKLECVEIAAYVPRRDGDFEACARDTVYVVIQGDGVFREQSSSRSFKTGDLIFVPAGAQHRFEAFSVDFASWVVSIPPGHAGAG